MSLLVWFLSEAAFPVSFGAAAALVVDVARRPRARHYRWRNRRFLRRVREIELRSRTPGGSGEDAGSVFPRPLPAPVGGDARPPRPVAAALPPAPCRLAGAGVPQPPAPARPPLRRPVAVMAKPEPACGASWGSLCWFWADGQHRCAWPGSVCTGQHKCGCGSGSSG